MSSAKTRLRSREVREGGVKYRTGMQEKSNPEANQPMRGDTAVTGRERINETF